MNWRVRLDLALDVSLASECMERPPSFLKGRDGTQRNSQREIGEGKKTDRGRNGEEATQFTCSSDKNSCHTFG